MDNEGNRPHQEYWAAVSREEIGSQIQNRVEDWYDYCQSSGRSYLWHRMYET
jgi:hypothetical protein